MDWKWGRTQEKDGIRKVGTKERRKGKNIKIEGRKRGRKRSRWEGGRVDGLELAAIDLFSLHR